MFPLLASQWIAIKMDSRLRTTSTSTCATTTLFTLIQSNSFDCLIFLFHSHRFILILSSSSSGNRQTHASPFGSILSLLISTMKNRFRFIPRLPIVRKRKRGKFNLATRQEQLIHFIQILNPFWRWCREERCLADRCSEEAHFSLSWT